MVDILRHILDLFVKLLRSLRRRSSRFGCHCGRKRSCDWHSLLSLYPLLSKRFLSENGGAAEWSSRASLQASHCRSNGASSGEGRHCGSEKARSDQGMRKSSKLLIALLQLFGSSRDSVTSRAPSAPDAGYQNFSKLTSATEPAACRREISRGKQGKLYTCRRWTAFLLIEQVTLSYSKCTTFSILPIPEI